MVQLTVYPPISSESLGREEAIYARRFTDVELETRRITWRVLCREFFQQFIPIDSTLLDIGSGEGHFLLNVEAARKIAVDIQLPEIEKFRALGIECFEVPATDLSLHVKGAADVAFMSNFLEHLPDKPTLFRVLEATRMALKSGGRLLILQPNIRYVGGKYWDYIDHHIALTEKSLAEALEVSGFSVERVIPRFLPYTVKSTSGLLTSLIGAERLVRAYLRFPPLWRIFGGQSFIIARRVR